MTIVEKSDKLGGQIHLAAIPPRKSEILRSVEYYEKILPTLNVNIELNSEATVDYINNFDQVIIAIGAHNMDVPFNVENSHVVSSWDVLNGAEVKGKCVVLGGGLVGSETTEFLINKGYETSIVEMLDKVAIGESSTVLPLVIKDFKEHNVTQYVNTKVNEIKDNIIHATNTTDNSEITIKADTIINALGSKKNIYNETGITVPLTYVGDCSGDKTADIASAIRSGYNAANMI